MIEIATFGEGLRADGPNWGQEALPHLQADWRVLAPGVVHYPDSHMAGMMTYTSVTALSDGRGRASLQANEMLPLLAPHLGEQVDPSIINTLTRILNAQNVPLDETNRFITLANMRVRDLAPGVGLGCIRLMGIVRYNPDSYRPYVVQ